jgi:hypothetical protein
MIRVKVNSIDGEQSERTLVGNATLLVGTGSGEFRLTVESDGQGEYVLVSPVPLYGGD